MFQKIKRFFMRENIQNYVIIFFITCIICIPMLSNRLSVKIDDGIQHLCRIIGTYQAVTEGQTFPVIMSNFCNGFGYSWSLFYSPITAYFPLIFKIFTSIFTNCFKIAMFVGLFFSGFFMYKFMKAVTNSNKIALLGAAIYILAPYHLVDIYRRWAIAETFAFIFLPILFLGIYNIFEKKENDFYFSIGAIGLILCHNISAFMAVIFGVIYIILNIKKLFDKKIIKLFIINTIFIIFITSFFWLPMLQNGKATLYEVFIQNRMGSVEGMKNNGIKIIDLIDTKNNWVIFELGFPTIIIFLLTPFVIKKVQNKRIYFIFLFMGILSLILSTKYFPWDKMPQIFGMIQFPWRFLEFAVFFLSFVCGVNIVTIIKDIKKSDVIIIIIILLIYTTIFSKYLVFESFNENDYFEGQKVTANQRINAGVASFEYLPSKAQINKEYIENRDNNIIVLYGNAQIEDYIKNGMFVKCTIKNAKEGTKLELPYIYYLGYKVTLEKNENKEILKTNESENGFVCVEISQNIENVQLNSYYEGTLLMKITSAVSIISICGLMIYSIYRYKS